MNFTDALPVEWMEGMTSVADKSGPAFFAIFCMVVGIFLINAQSRRKHVAAYFSFLLAGGIIASITLISAANRTFRYDFKIFDAASSLADIADGKGLEIIASEQEDVWLKSRNSVNQFYLIALRNEPFQPNDSFEVYVSDPTTFELTRHRVDYCTGVSNPLYELEKIDDAAEGTDSLRIRASEPCAETVAANPGWGAAFAQSFEPAPLAGKLKLSAASAIALRYYEKPSDQGRVSQAVEGLIAEETTNVRAISEPSISSDKSNALWFGAEVPVDVAGALAIQLIENGVELHYFGPYVNADTRINTVEVGHSANEAASPTLSVNDIELKMGLLRQ